MPQPLYPRERHSTFFFLPLPLAKSTSKPKAPCNSLRKVKISVSNSGVAEHSSLLEFFTVLLGRQSLLQYNEREDVLANNWLPSDKV